MRERLVDASRRARARAPGQQRAELQVLAHRQARERLAGPRHLDDAEIADCGGRLSRRVAPVEADAAARAAAPRRRWRGSSDRLAGAVGADERDDLALRDRERDPVERLRRRRRPAGVDLEQRNHGAPSRGKRRAGARGRQQGLLAEVALEHARRA